MGFSAPASLIFGLDGAGGGSLLCALSMTGKTPGLYPPEASGTLQSLTDQLKHLQTVTRVPRAQNCPLLENHYTNKSA